jgi:hypothetical protein
VARLADWLDDDDDDDDDDGGGGGGVGGLKTKQSEAKQRQTGEACFCGGGLRT